MRFWGQLFSRYSCKYYDPKVAHNSQNYKGGSKLEIFIPQFVRTALDRLNECGYEGYIVGGCVRDSLLGKSLMITMSAQTAP